MVKAAKVNKASCWEISGNALHTALHVISWTKTWCISKHLSAKFPTVEFKGTLKFRYVLWA